MARPAANFDKFRQMASLNPGDKVKLTDGSIAEFVKLKQKNFDGIIDGKLYNVPVNMFVEVIEKADLGSKLNDAQNMTPGEMFYIAKDGKALLFKFERIERGKIIGINPVSKGRTTIDMSLFAGKVADL